MHHLVHWVSVTRGPQAVKALSKELKRAKVVAAQEIQKDVITMNSLVQIKELKSMEEMEIKIVYPKDSNLVKHRISVLAPMATAILGCRVGDEIEWSIANDTVIYKVEEILYQPEAAGNSQL